MQNAIIIFVRNPELGKVKTRLAATIGNEKTLAIYKALLQHTRSIVDDVHAHKFVFYTDVTNPDDIWNDCFKLIQSNGDLGKKIQDAFQLVFNLGYNNVCIIGSDCYDLSTAIIRDAFTALQTKEVVLGPANDGGYYLLGTRQVHVALFEDKQWSTATVLADTEKDCKDLDLSYHLLPTLMDIDDIEDLKQTELYNLVQL
jgi:uncharacterized protein